jgi:hypothetical protein
MNFFLIILTLIDLSKCLVNIDFKSNNNIIHIYD